MYTSNMRMTGSSGMDIEGMVKQLMMAESQKLYKMQKSKISMQWRQESYRSVSNAFLNTQAKNFSFLGSGTNFLAPSNFKSFSTSIKQNIAGVLSDSRAVNIAIKEGAASGTHKIKVNSIAEKDSFRSSEAASAPLTGKAVFDYTQIKAGDKFNVSIDGEAAKTIEFDSDDDISTQEKFLEALNSKLGKAFGVESGKNKVIAKMDSTGANIMFESPTNHTVRLTENSTETITTKTTLGSLDEILASLPTKTETIEGEEGPTTITTKPLAGAFSINDKSYILNIADTSDMTSEDIISHINTQISGSGVTASVNTDGKLEFTNNNVGKEVTFTDGEEGVLAKLGATVDPEDEDGKAKINIAAATSKSPLSVMGIENGASSAVSGSSKIGDIFTDSNIFVNDETTFSINGKSLTVSKDTTVDQLLSKINNMGAGVTATFDKTSGKFSMASNETGAVNKIEMSGALITSGMKLTERTGTASDSSITYNGSTFTRTTNRFELEVFTLNLTSDSVNRDPNTGTITPKEFTIDIKNDSTKPLDTIKQFVETYNSIIDSLFNQIDTKRPKSDKYSYYEPLTAEEKKELKEAEITEYEAKAKEGLLYNDPKLRSIASELRSLMYQKVELGDGKSISLFQIGITTSSSMKDNGKLVIDEEKLKKALEERPDDVMNLFTKSSEISTRGNRYQRNATQGLADRINDVINRSVSTAGVLAEEAGIKDRTSDKDNKLTKMIEKQDELIEKMLESLRKKETNYYSVFNRMETAMKRAEAQMSQMAGYFG